MIRRILALCLCILSFPGCVVPQQRQVAHNVIVLDSLLTYLDSIADTATIEHYRCLLGWSQPDTLKIFGAWEPPIAHADYNGVQPLISCPDGTVGEWHNHIPYTVPMTDPHNRSQRVEPWSVCELSPQDRRTAMRVNAAYQLLSVQNGVHCAWARIDDSSLARIPWRRP